LSTTYPDLLSKESLHEASERLAPLPAAASRLTTMLSRSDVNMREVVDIITYDPVLTAALLRQANSAQIGLTRAATTVSDAVMRLGLGSVASVAMRTAVGPELQRPLRSYGLGRGEIFAHSVKCAVAAELLRATFPDRVPAAAATVALLHDVGKLLICDVLGERVVELVADVSQADEISIFAAESEIFGINHGQAGVYALRHWKLPLSFAEAVANHHADPEQASSLGVAVRCADDLAHAISTGDGDMKAERTRAAGPTAACAVLGIDPASYPRFVTAIEERYLAVSAGLAA
jgi:putative nucleotidyltransferase with HDIG domain